MFQNKADMACTCTFSPGSCVMYMYQGLVQNMLVSRDDIRLAWPICLVHLRSCHRSEIVLQLRSSLRIACIFSTSWQTAYLHTDISEELLGLKTAKRFMYQHVGHNQAAFPCAADNCLLCWAAYTQPKQ